MAAFTSPFWLRTKAWSASRPSFSMSAIVALDTFAFGPSSQTMGSASSAVLACHHVSATTATAGIADLHHVPDARHARDLGGLEALHLAAEDRAVLDRGVEHPGQLQVHAVDLGAGQLVHRVEALHRLADELPVLRVLERHVRGRRQLGGGLRDLAVRGRAARGPVRDHAVGGAALGGGHLPGVGRGLDQHHPRRGAALAHVLVRLADAAAAARGEVAPHALARDALAGRRDIRSSPSTSRTRAPRPPSGRGR